MMKQPTDLFALVPTAKTGEMLSLHSEDGNKSTFVTATGSHWIDHITGCGWLGR
jgi:hypothetical protein